MKTGPKITPEDLAQQIIFEHCSNLSMEQRSILLQVIEDALLTWGCLVKEAVLKGED